jgi:hypothetical protein
VYHKDRRRGADATRLDTNTCTSSRVAQLFDDTEVSSADPVTSMFLIFKDENPNARVDEHHNAIV